MMPKNLNMDEGQFRIALARHGWEMVGSGAYSEVFGRPDRPYVAKLGRVHDDVWLAWRAFSLRYPEPFTIKYGPEAFFRGGGYLAYSPRLNPCYLRLFKPPTHSALGKFLKGCYSNDEPPARYLRRFERLAPRAGHRPCRGSPDKNGR